MSLKKVTILGAGHVGAEAANQLISRDLADVVLIDKDGDSARGKALDILTSVSLKNSGSNIIGTDDYSFSKNSDVVIITAGIPRKPGMKREELAETNGKIVTEITENIKQTAPNAVIIMVTNPLDVMTHLAWKISGFDAKRVVGMAGILDTIRFKTFVAKELGVMARDVQAMVLGGHGDEMVPLVDYANVSGVPLKQLIKPDVLQGIIERTQKGGAEIVKLLKTGSAYYAPAAAAVDMAEVVLKDRRSVLPASVLLNGQYGINDIFLGVPIVLGKNGVEKVIEFDLGQENLDNLQKSASVVRKTIQKLENSITV